MRLFDRLSSTALTRITDVKSIHVQCEVSQRGTVSHCFCRIVDGELETLLILVRVMSHYPFADLVGVEETMQEV
jgi:hypothetical protein